MIHNFRLPNVKKIVLNRFRHLCSLCIELVLSQFSIEMGSVSIEMYRGILFPEDAHRTISYESTNCLETCVLQGRVDIGKSEIDSNLCDSIFPFLVLPLATQATTIDIRSDFELFS